MFTDEEKTRICAEIQSEKHEIMVVSPEAFEEALRTSSAWGRLKSSWKKLKKVFELGAAYTATALDINTLGKLIGDLGGTGRVFIKSYGGKAHIILKGNPRLRKFFTGTKYGVNNSKVVSMGLGKAGAIKAVKGGALISIVLVSAYRVFDYFLSDEATLSQLIGSIATDVVKIGISAGASILAASAVAGMGCTIAIGPLVAVIVVGIGVSMALNALDEHYGITNRVIKALEDLSQKIEKEGKETYDELKESLHRVVDQTAEKIGQSINDAIDATEEAIKAIDYIIGSARNTLISAAEHSLGKFIANNFIK